MAELGCKSPVQACVSFCEEVLPEDFIRLSSCCDANLMESPVPIYEMWLIKQWWRLQQTSQDVWAAY